MKKCYILIFIIFIMFSFLVVEKNVYAKTSINSESYILIEKESLRVLAGENIDKQLLTASICKIMTCIVGIENGSLDQEYVVTSDVVNQVGSSIYLTVGEKIKLIDLLYGMMLRSGNDAAYMIAKCIGGNVENFVEMMNEKAKEVGMKNSVFSNPSGLDDESYNYSSAYDMGILIAYCLNNKVFSSIVSTKTHIFESDSGIKKTFLNKHKLVRGYDFITGGKTGV